MKTLNESLLEEFDDIIKAKKKEDSIPEGIDVDILRKMYSDLLKFKGESADFAKDARTLINTALNNYFRG